VALKPSFQQQPIKEEIIDQATSRLLAAPIIIGAFFMILAQEPKIANAQEAESAAPVLSISAASVSLARRAVTANGTRPGAENSRVHILPTRSARFTLPASVLNRNNFYGFSPSAMKISPIFTTPVPGIPARPKDGWGAVSNAAPSRVKSCKFGQFRGNSRQPIWRRFSAAGEYIPQLSRP
jgi:hypothetical protein